MGAASLLAAARRGRGIVARGPFAGKGRGNTRQIAQAQGDRPPRVSPQNAMALPPPPPKGRGEEIEAGSILLFEDPISVLVGRPRGELNNVHSMLIAICGPVVVAPKELTQSCPSTMKPVSDILRPPVKHLRNFFT